MVTELERRIKALRAAEEKVVKGSEARRALKSGSSRARVTTANARHASACEERDRLLWALSRYVSDELHFEPRAGDTLTSLLSDALATEIRGRG